MTWGVVCGDCREVMAGMDAGSVQCVVTSPPYWGLRDYGTGECQLGLEPTPEIYVEHLVEIFRQVRRVLRDDGTVWLNLGDSYATGAGRVGDAPGGGVQGEKWKGHRGVHTSDNSGKAGYRIMGPMTQPNRMPIVGLKPKDLVGIPWRVAFALQADGWWLRSDIIWSKPNPMPESVRDRPTRAHEYIFLLSKSARYYYDADAIAEPAEDWGLRDRTNAKHNTEMFRSAGQPPHKGLSDCNQAESGRNRRSVWYIATEPYPDAHFATFPTKLVEPCILAGTSAAGQCVECGAPRQRITENSPMEVREGPKGRVTRTQTSGTMIKPPESRTIGWRDSCDCAVNEQPDARFGTAGYEPQTVLDPFCGAGTTGIVALRHNRKFIGIEQKAEYVEMARRRIEDDCPMFNHPEGGMRL